MGVVRLVREVGVVLGLVFVVEMAGVVGVVEIVGESGLWMGLIGVWYCPSNWSMVGAGAENVFTLL